MKRIDGQVSVDGVELMSMARANLLVGASGVAFLVGLYFPIMVLLDPGPSPMVYGIVLVSFPAWALGLLSGGFAAYRASRVGQSASRLKRLSWLIGILNILAFLICLIWSPPGIS